MGGNKKQPSVLRSIDWWTIAIYIALFTFGWISVCGASYSYGETDIFSLSTRSGMQIVWIGTSIVLGFVIVMLDDRFYDTFAYIIYALLLLLLFATIFNPHSIKGSRSWLVLGPLRLQPAEFAKFATALALAKFMSAYGYNINQMKHFAVTLALILMPMVCIVLQRETGSALVYMAFFLMFYREGMPGSILFTGVAMVVYFVVGIRFADVHIGTTEATSVGRFAVMLLIQIFSIGMVWVYCNQRIALRMLLYWLGITLASLLLLKLPFDIVYIQIATLVILIGYCIWEGLGSRIRSYFFIALFAMGSAAFFHGADFILQNVMEPHQRSRINVLLGLDEDLRGAGYNVHQSEIAIGSGGFLYRWRRRGIPGFSLCATIVPGIDIKAYLLVGTTTIAFQQDLWLLCAVYIPVPCLHQCGHGAGTDACDWYSTAVLQLWRLFAVGLHIPAVYLPAPRRQP